MLTYADFNSLDDTDVRPLALSIRVGDPNMRFSVVSYGCLCFGILCVHRNMPGAEGDLNSYEFQRQ